MIQILTLLTSFQGIITGFMLMVSAKRTGRKSIVGVQDRDTLIEQSHDYSNRTLSRYIFMNS